MPLVGDWLRCIKLFAVCSEIKLGSKAPMIVLSAYVQDPMAAELVFRT